MARQPRALLSQVSPNHRRRPMPQSQPPTLIEREYGAALRRLLSRSVFERAFSALLAELPALLESARYERGDTAQTPLVLDGLDLVSRARVVLARAHARMHGCARADADEGRRARALVARAREQLRAAISTSAVEALAEKFAQQTSTYQRIQLNRQTRAVLGADIITGDRGLRNRISVFASENVAKIKGLSDQVAARVEVMVTAALTRGTPHPKLAEQLNEAFGLGEERSALIARDQIGKFYGQIGAARQKDLGVERFTWRTVGDERVRSEHADLDGEVFSYDDLPLDEDGSPMIPGEPINCRCWADPVLDDVLADDDEDEGTRAPLARINVTPPRTHSPAPDDDEEE